MAPDGPVEIHASLCRMLPQSCSTVGRFGCPPFNSNRQYADSPDALPLRDSTRHFDIHLRQLGLTNILYRSETHVPQHVLKYPREFSRLALLTPRTWPSHSGGSPPVCRTGFPSVYSCPGEPCELLCHVASPVILYRTVGPPPALVSPAPLARPTSGFTYWHLTKDVPKIKKFVRAELCLPPVSSPRPVPAVRI
ncbi:hypothetical protein C8T65DRAFT_255285 [Cerioporus squamosus]|nr:hypothetical protein C8T65DRAFT_255285 [Cerioporus squamosus]